MTDEELAPAPLFDPRDEAPAAYDDEVFGRPPVLVYLPPLAIANDPWIAIGRQEFIPARFAARVVNEGVPLLAFGVRVRRLGEPEIDWLTLARRDGDPSLTAVSIRVRLGEYLKIARETVSFRLVSLAGGGSGFLLAYPERAESHDLDVLESIPLPPSVAELAAQRSNERHQLRRRRARSDDELRRVAEAFTRAEGERSTTNRVSTTRAVMDELPGVSWATAQRRIREARERGFLPPLAAKRRANGETDG